MSIGALLKRRRLVIISRRGAERPVDVRLAPTEAERRRDDMPLTITLHVFGFTITVRVKYNNRHSDLVPVK